MNKKEQWKWIDGFIGYYKISDHGRLMSFWNDSGGKIKNVTNKTGGYLTTSLHKKDEKMTVRIHRLVAEAFIGEIPVGYEVHHKDGNKQNNIVSNLEIITTKEHRMKTMAQMPDYFDGMNRYNKYERPKKIRQYTQDGHFIAEYANGVIAEYYTKVCKRNILQVANHTEYKPGKVRSQAGGFVWVFADEDKR